MPYAYTSEAVLGLLPTSSSGAVQERYEERCARRGCVSDESPPTGRQSVSSWVLSVSGSLSPKSVIWAQAINSHECGAKRQGGILPPHGAQVPVPSRRGRAQLRPRSNRAARHTEDR
jgi:hypothetical protein